MSEQEPSKRSKGARSSGGQQAPSGRSGERAGESGGDRAKTGSASGEDREIPESVEPGLAPDPLGVGAGAGDSWVDRLTDSAVRFASRTGGFPFRLGRAILSPQGYASPERLKTMAQTGEYLRDVRELAGLTISDVNDALDLRDENFLQAVEDGTAALSFELILRLASLLARHDPIPFIIKFTRTYNPEVWRFMEDWGVGRIPLQFERERQFLNIYRRHDGARKLSDEGFQKVLDFTRSAFEMSLHFVAEQENVQDEEIDLGPGEA